MPDRKQHEFAQRLAQIGNKKQRLSDGYATAVTSDGLIIAQPARRRRSLLPWRPVLFVLVAVMTAKIYLLASMGPELYAARILPLAEGTMFEQLKLWVMTPDIVSVWTAEQIAEIIATIRG